MTHHSCCSVGAETTLLRLTCTTSDCRSTSDILYGPEELQRPVIAQGWRVSQQYICCTFAAFNVRERYDG
jgi:hypothetical protein